MDTKTASPTASPEARLLWNQIGDRFRQACILKHAGKNQDADAILRDELPQTIALWARQSELSASEQAIELRRLFQAEQQRIREVWSAQDALAQSLTQRVVHSVSGLVAQEIKTLVASQLGLGNSDHFGNSRALLRTRSQGPYKRLGPQGHPWTDIPFLGGPSRPSPSRLSFDDIPGAIDSVLSQQQCSPLPVGVC